MKRKLTFKFSFRKKINLVISMEVFKICLIGGTEVGKTSFVNALLDKNNNGVYVRTLGVDVEPVRLPMVNPCNIWDIAGDDSVRGLDDGYYVESHAAIIMFDATNPTSIYSGCRYIQGFRQMCPEAPIYYVVNKCDISHLGQVPQSAKFCTSFDSNSCKNVMREILLDIQENY